MLRLLIALLTLNGCGAMVNLAQQAKPRVSIYANNSLNQSPWNNKKIALKVHNLTAENIINTSAIQEALTKQGNLMVDNLTEAEIIANVTIKNFTTIKEHTADNVHKLMTYRSITAPLSDNGGTKIHFGVDDGHVFWSSDSDKPPKRGAVGKNITNFAKSDAISGIVIGSLVATLAGAGTMIFAISAIGGAVVTAGLQRITEPKYYLATIDIQISQKQNNPVKQQIKIVNQNGISGTKETYHNLDSDWLHYDTQIVLLAERCFNREVAVYQINKKTHQIIANIIPS